jgi:hypothetical protein
MERNIPRDKTHEDQIERWAKHVKNTSDWKKELKPFLDAQIINAIKKYKRILTLPNGEDKLRRIRNLN